MVLLYFSYKRWRGNRLGALGRNCARSCLAQK